MNREEKGRDFDFHGEHQMFECKFGRIGMPFASVAAAYCVYTGDLAGCFYRIGFDYKLHSHFPTRSFEK